MTPTEMELRVARAISGAIQDWMTEQLLDMHTTGKSNKVLYSPLMFQSVARAAIRHMREPTDDVLAAGYAASYEADTGVDEIAEVVVEHAWTAMIDAASPPQETSK
jgi:hypothetical protein